MPFDTELHWTLTYFSCISPTVTLHCSSVLLVRRSSSSSSSPTFTLPSLARPSTVWKWWGSAGLVTASCGWRSRGTPAELPSSCSTMTLRASRRSRRLRRGEEEWQGSAWQRCKRRRRRRRRRWLWRCLTTARCRWAEMSQVQLLHSQFLVCWLCEVDELIPIAVWAAVGSNQRQFSAWWSRSWGHWEENQLNVPVFDDREHVNSRQEVPPPAGI